MHIIIGAITALAGLIWALVALQRAGVDLGGFNPFAWHRRTKWQKTYGEKPLYKLDKPMEVAAVLLLGIAKCEGEVTADQKQELMSIFERDFHLGRDESADLLLASAHLIRNEIYLIDNLERILERSSSSFTSEQVSSLIALLRRVAEIGGAPNQEQQKLISATERYFAPKQKGRGKWG